MSYSLVQGDLDPQGMPITLVAPDAIAALTGALAVNMRWKKPDGTTSVVSLAVVTTSPPVVKKVWVAGDSDQVGLHRGQVVITASNGASVSDPNDGTNGFTWNVYPQLS